MDDQIKIYGTSWCPDCARAKQVFNKLKVSFEWINIDQDKNSAAYVEKINRGFKSVPTIVFPDNSILVEPSNAELEKKIKSFTMGGK
jgi:Glutaredoxin and related proteins